MKRTIAQWREAALGRWAKSDVVRRRVKRVAVGVALTAAALVMGIAALLFYAGLLRAKYSNDVATIRVGMTAAQVESILGTPQSVRTRAHEYFYKQLSCAPCNTAASQWQYQLMGGFDLFCFDEQGVLVGIYHT